MLEKRPEEISLMDVINCTESTMAISRFLEKDGYCSRNYSDCCKVHKVLLDLQNTYNNRLENVKISDIIQPGKDEYFGRFYVVIKLNLKDQTYECIYSHVHEVYDKVSASASYGEFVKKYTEQYVHEQDRQKLQEFLASEKLTEHLVDGCIAEFAARSNPTAARPTSRPFTAWVINGREARQNEVSKPIGKAAV